MDERVRNERESAELGRHQPEDAVGEPAERLVGALDHGVENLLSPISQCVGNRRGPATIACHPEGIASAVDALGSCKSFEVPVNLEVGVFEEVDHCLLEAGLVLGPRAVGPHAHHPICRKHREQQREGCDRQSIR